MANSHQASYFAGTSNTSSWRRGWALLWLPQRPGSIENPGGEIGLASRRSALRDRPMVEPARPLSDVRVRKAIGRIAQGILEGNEMVSALAHEGGEISNVVGLQPVGV